MDIIVEFWGTLTEMAPWLLFGFFMAGILSVFISPELIEKHLGGHGFWPIFKASLFGVPLPLCSCGVIPVATSLRNHGSSKGATTAFLLSTPQTGVDSILATYSLLGPVFAIFRPVAAFITGVIGGGIVEALDSGSVETESPNEDCKDECCSQKAHSGKMVRALRYGFITLPKDIGKPLIVGLIIAGSIAAFVPKDFFGDVLGKGFLSMLVMMALGIPVYVCATASIPVAAAMMLKGVTPGAALVFLMTGPATNAAAIAALWKVLGKKPAIIYLFVVAGSALISGMLLDYFFNVAGCQAYGDAQWMLPPVIKNVLAILLLIVLGCSCFGSRKHAQQKCCS